ncbi:MAG: murein biosynthesis integral membrane protein MurJ [Anaerolineae bacterium]|nr:murein biosynthesis integral membrane protein MurJ [Anaerolineae bacterium]
MTDDHPTNPGTLSGRQIARATGIVMLAFVASGVLGIVRQSAISSAFGAGARLDAFVAARAVPETLFVLVAGGALGSAFIPVFTQFLATGDERAAWRLADAVLTLVSGVAAVLALIAFVLAGPIMDLLLLPDADASTQALGAELMRIMLLTVVIFGVSGLMMGLLNAHQHFLTPALAPSLYNIGLIFGALVLARNDNIHGLAWGAVIGAGLHLGVQIPALRRIEFRYRPLLSLDVPGVKRVLWLMGPRVLGLGVVQVNVWVNTALASGMMKGSITAFSWAFTLMFTVIGVLGQSVGMVVFPTLSALSAQQDSDEFRRTLAGALSSVLFLSIPAGIGLAVVARPVVALLFEHGDWTTTDTAGTAWALALFCVGLAGHTVLEVLVRAFYALNDTWTPVKVGTATMLLNIVLSLALIRVFGYPNGTNFGRGPFGGLALAMSIATAVESTTLWIILRRRIGGIEERRVLGGAARTLAASGVMALAAGGFLYFLDGLPLLFQVGGAMGIGAVVFWIAAMLLNVEEAEIVPRLVLRRLRG